ncbi:Gfo/Idh/MocA family oxidoreductase [Haloferula sp. BvORR071]|uniref:Gfo/Idh/MocA family protein n=1 Tax=Haloferula sp. BvORR071 TaxID=1396141 RepID=UPI0005594492|nr:Gfo/Idh/MocA family oxidoreductase [Haloferula sp. BvORR071]
MTVPSSDRRSFLKAGTIAAAASALPSVLHAQAGGSDEIKIALIGCGGRGSGAAAQSLAVPGTRLIAMADAFGDNLDIAHDQLKAQFGERVDVPKERRFTGFEAYKQAIDAAQVVLLCTPPGFRPAHFEYAVQQGKHIFMEKPVAVDGPGIRRVIEAAKIADQKKLKVVCGLQRRYQKSYLETLKQIEGGMIGDHVSSQVYWVSGGVWVRDRKPGMTEMEYQMRNWYYFNWICGDHITEQHVHNLDVGNWFKKDHPVKAVGMGGRTKRVGKEYGEIYDHFYVEYSYADGTVMNAQARHWNDVWSRVSETFAGTAGTAYPGMIKDRKGKVIWRFNGQDNNPYDTEHVVLYDHIRSDTPINNAYYTAESTLTSILGRMACYSGGEVTWDQALNSTLDTMPKRLAWDADPGPKPGSDGMYPCPIPGVGTVV